MEPTNANVTCEVSVQGDVAILAIRGKLDRVEVTRVREEIASVPEKVKAKVVLDLSELSWIDSSGVGALVQLFKNAQTLGGRVVAANLQRQPKEIFRLLRLESAFKIVDTVEGALTELAAG